MTPTPIFIPPPLHEEHFVHLAEIHFKAEENLRLADIHFKAEQDPQSFNPDHLSARTLPFLLTYLPNFI